MATVKDSLVIANPLPSGDGYTWTLASRLGEMISDIEVQFGKRDRSWTILGIEFCDNGPQTWFPGDSEQIIIQLGLSAKEDPVQAKFQLAHLSVHLLDPGASSFATVLEQGLATYFSLQYVKQFHPNYTTSDTKYAAAARLTAQLLYINPIAIKELRSRGIKISQITASQLLAVCPKLPKSIALALVTPFHNWIE
ncbi:hypothetical protein [uncultured Nostoc sp.]|uniref:hypothetical protein n=1 Tax=uncultured Nostoc sp. TaxID=340711 RepID=UPI0035CC1B5D